MTFRVAMGRMAMAGLAVAAALGPGPAAAQAPSLAVADLVGAPIEGLNEIFKGALKPAWTGADGTAVYVGMPGRCRISRDGEALSLAVLTRDGRIEAVLSRPGPRIAFNRKRQPYLSPSDDPLAPAPGELPMVDGLGATTGRLMSLALPADAVLQMQCSDRPQVFPAAKRSEGLQAVVELPAEAAAGIWFAPIWLFGVPAENRSRELGARLGPVALAEVKLGDPLAGGPEGFRDRHRQVVRLHAGSGDYAVLSIDLGGPPGRGISLPRETVFVGVRGGVVEWIGGTSGGLGQSLCTGPNGRFGGRKGCTTTGYYSPRV